MNKKLSRILLTLGLSVVIAVAVGCSDDDDDDNNNPPVPTYSERLVGFWQATDAGPQLGSDSVKVRFTSSGTFTYQEWFTLLDANVLWEGDYSANSAGDITFMVDHIDGVAADTTFTWESQLYASDDSLHLFHDFGSGPATQVTYVNVTPPVN